MRIGFGYDVHQFTEGDAVVLGGTEIPFHKKLKGHSDADVLLHAITDAFLGALAMGDIGTHFPDTDPEYKNADSAELLANVCTLIREKGYELVNVDATVIAEKPKLMPYVHRIRSGISACIGCSIDQVSVKATTNEKMGFLGREEGIAAHAVVLLKKLSV